MTGQTVTHYRIGEKLGEGASAVVYRAEALALGREVVIKFFWPGGLSGTSRFGLMAGAAFALDLAFWHYGIANTSVSKATVLANITPIIVTILVWLIFRQRPAPLFLLAVALSVAGGAIMALAKGAGVIGPNPLLGDTLSAVTSVWYALYFLAMSEARRRQGTTQVMFWSSLTRHPGAAAIAWVSAVELVPGDAQRLGRVCRAGRRARGRSGTHCVGARTPAALDGVGHRARAASGHHGARLVHLRRAYRPLAGGGRGAGPDRHRPRPARASA
jgi:hypothetical protein